MAIKKSPKVARIFNCSNCQYFTCKKSDYDKHLSTRKHNVSHVGNDLAIKKSPKVATSYMCCCGKKYETYSGLWRHHKICETQITQITETIQQNSSLASSNEITPELILCVLQQNKELQSLVIEQNKTIQELAKTNQTNNINYNNINSNNKSFNLNFFLNETCKNAMNISDFVNSLKIELDDLVNVGEVGFVNGITNIIVKNLKEMDITQRPVHCTDSKREVLYVKDENKWEKECGNMKLRKAIKSGAFKNSRMLVEFRKKYPDCGKSNSKYADKYNKLVIEAMGGKVICDNGENDLEKENKIIRNIAKEVVIEK